MAREAITERAYFFNDGYWAALYDVLEYLNKGRSKNLLAGVDNAKNRNQD